MAKKYLSVFVHSDFSTSIGSGQIEIQYWDLPEQKKRAMKYAAICFGLALASIFLPIAHFVLVPGFLAATPVVFYMVKRQQDTLLGGNCSCPCCSENIVIAPQPNKFPIQEICVKCRKSISINLQ